MPGEKVILRPTSDIQWVRDADRTLLADDAGRCWTLGGIEIAVWDHFVLGYSFAATAEMVGILTGAGYARGFDRLEEITRRWVHAGLLCVDAEALP